MLQEPMYLKKKVNKNIYSSTESKGGQIMRPFLAEKMRIIDTAITIFSSVYNLAEY